MTKTEEQISIQESTDGTWLEKFLRWRGSHERHWSWRNDVMSFLEKKARKENPRFFGAENEVGLEPSEAPDFDEFVR